WPYSSNGSAPNLSGCGRAGQVNRQRMILPRRPHLLKHGDRKCNVVQRFWCDLRRLGYALPDFEGVNPCPDSLDNYLLELLKYRPRGGTRDISAKSWTELQEDAARGVYEPRHVLAILWGVPGPWLLSTNEPMNLPYRRWLLRVITSDVRVR